MTGLSSPALWCAVALGLCALLCLRGLIGRLLRLVLRSGAGLVLLAALARFGSALVLVAYEVRQPSSDFTFTL